MFCRQRDIYGDNSSKINANWWDSSRNATQMRAEYQYWCQNGSNHKPVGIILEFIPTQTSYVPIGILEYVYWCQLCNSKDIEVPYRCQLWVSTTIVSRKKELIHTLQFLYISIYVPSSSTYHNSYIQHTYSIQWQNFMEKSTISNNLPQHIFNPSTSFREKNIISNNLP